MRFGPHRRVFRRGILACALPGLLLFAAARAPSDPAGREPNPRQQEAPEVTVRRNVVRPAPLIRVDVNRVVVPITVTDQDGRVITGLEPAHFEIYDDKVRQEILSFETEDAPIAVGVIFDSSGSMADKIWICKEAALEFYKTSNPQDEFMLITFSNRASLLGGFTSNFESVLSRLVPLRGGGRTALLDAIYLGLAEMRRAESSRKALVVMSDGGDNHSRYTERDIKQVVRESNVQIYVVGVFEPLHSRDRTPEEAAGPSLLSELAEISGGQMFAVEDPRELPDIMTKLSSELRNQYVLGYKPSNLVRDGRWRRIKVKLNPPRGLPPLQVYARTGYYAPAI